MTASRWNLETVAGSAGDLHALDVEPRRTVRVHEVNRAAVVLGSTQSDSLLGRPSHGAAAEFEVARRRSGGGAVWLAPGAQVWVDLVIPAGDPLWHDDVGRASHWVGQAWAASLGAGRAGGADEVATGTEVWRGAVLDRDLARVACFAGIGPGEVLVDGRKVVGISQRRTRHLARFQCVVHLEWDPEPLIAALGAGKHRGGSGPGGPGVRAGPAMSGDGTVGAGLLAEVADRLRTGVSPLRAADRAAVDGSADRGRPDEAMVTQWGVVERLCACLP